MNVDDSCCLCNTACEACEHLFFACPYSKEVWKKVLAAMGCNRTPRPWTSEWCWILRNCKGRRMRKRKVLIAMEATVYFVWRERNTRIFNSTMMSVQQLVPIILSYIELKTM